MKSIFVIFVILLNSIQFSVGDEIQEEINFTKSLNNIYSDLVTGKFSADSDVIKFLSAKTGNYNNDRCNRQLQVILDQFNETVTTTELWANEMFDASGKIPDGLLYGNRYSLGNFDECLQILHDSGTEEDGLIKGQYCLVPLSLLVENFGGPFSHFVVMSAMCIPDSCEPAYFLGLLQGALTDSNAAVIPLDPETLCNIDNPIELAPIDIVAIIAFTTIIALMIASTVYDVYTTQTKQKKRDLFMAYSIITNGRRLFSVIPPKSPDVIHCLNGIRVLSLVWIILGHGFGTVITNPMNLGYVNDVWITNPFAMIIASGPVAVDSFFLLSGLLVVYNVFKEMNKTNGKLNIPMMYLHRYLRITPPLFMTILLTVSFISHIGQGPFSKQGGPQFEPCEKYWWSSLLYIQNYVNPDELCLLHSWYLQIDMQLFILSPLILIPLWKWGRKALPILFTILFLSLGCYFATAYVNKATVGLLADGGLSFNGTHYRLGTWMTGILLGYAIIKTKNRKLEFPNWLVYGGWCIAILIFFIVVFGQYHIHQPEYVETPFESAIYESLHRIAWCTALSWIIFACVKGYGGYIDSFLSHSAWLPLTRLSYSMYLLSYILQVYRSKISKVPKYFSDYTAINIFWGDFGITFTVAIFWVLAFESPVPILEKVIFGRKSKPPPLPPVQAKDTVLDTIEIK